MRRPTLYKEKNYRDMYAFGTIWAEKQVQIAILHF